MNKLIIIISLGILISGCASANKWDSNNNNMNGDTLRLQVHKFSEIPKDILDNLDKMGMDNSSTLNEYEGRYLNCIFKTDSLNINLTEKKVGFLGSKKDYFESTRSPDRDFTTVGASSLYIFDAVLKEESGGYDAVITYWKKFLLPIDEVAKRMKRIKLYMEAKEGE